MSLVELERPVVPAGPPAPRAAGRPTSAGSRESRAVLLASLLVYAALGVWLVLVEHVVFLDAVSRVGNATWAATGRDPHLSALGFVWNPLPSLTMMPLVLLGDAVPDLVRVGLAANAVSAVAMAGAVMQVHRLLEDLGLSAAARRSLTAVFALHPMVLLYGGNGMSEAFLLLFLLWSCRALLEWVRADHLPSLVRCGVLLGLAYLARYEALVATAGATACVLAVGLARSTGSAAAARRARAACDTFLVASPTALAFGVWAAMSWVVVGTPFATFTSRYGNGAQVAGGVDDITAVTGTSMLSRTQYLLEQVLLLAPALPVVLLLAGVLLVRRGTRSTLVLVPLLTLGAVLAAQSLALVLGLTFGWLRFSITSIPLVLVCGAVLASALQGRRRRAAAWLTVLAGLVSIPTSGIAMADRALAREEASVLRAALVPSSAAATDRRLLERLTTEREIARTLDAMDLPRGSVLVDVATGYGIVLASADRDQFVITTDRDFEAVAADPQVYDIRHVVVSKRPEDALGALHPGLFASGLPFLRLVGDHPDASTSRGHWRVYEVVREG